MTGDGDDTVVISGTSNQVIGGEGSDSIVLDNAKNSSFLNLM